MSAATGDREIWRAIEREALEQVRADVEAVEAQPLGFGSVVAWVECRFGRTDGLTDIHRVGEPLRGEPAALCGELIPCAMMRFVLSPDLIRTLPRCRFCESSYLQKGNAA